MSTGSQPLPLVLVEWVDSHGPDGWTHLDDIHHEITPCRSAGWLYAESKETITILSHTSEIESSRHGQAQGIMTIPRVAITRIVRLKEGARYRQRG